MPAGNTLCSRADALVIGVVLPLLLVCGISCVIPDQPGVDHLKQYPEAVSVVATVMPERVSRPYELDWYKQNEAEEPLVDFNRLMGWGISGFDTSRAAFVRSSNKQLWGDYTGHFVIRNPGTNSVMLVPPRAIPVPRYFDCVTLWVYAPGLWPGIEPPTVSLRIRDADGVEHRLPLGSINWKGWWLIQRKISPEELRTYKPPCEFRGMHLQFYGGLELYELFFDSLAVYAERLPALNNFSTNLAAGLEAQLQAGAVPVATNVVRTAIQPHEQGYHFDIEDGAHLYRLKFDPHRRLDGLSLQVDGALMGPLFEGTTSEPMPELLIERMEKDSMLFEYSDGFRVRVGFTNHVFAIDLASRLGTTSSMELNGPGFYAEPIELPGLGSPNDYRPVIVAAEARSGTTVYVTSYFDWFRSQASRLEPVEEGFGRSVYDTATNGRRNPFRERIIVGASYSLNNLFPGIPWSPHPASQKLSNRLLVERSSVVRFEDTPLGDFPGGAGLTNLLVTFDSSVWADRYESISLREKAAPGRGGDEGLLELVRSEDERGSLVALYQDFSCVSPLNQHWSPQLLSREPGGDWKALRPGAFAIKPQRCLPLIKEYSEKIFERYQPDLLLLQDNLEYAPWKLTDHDARVPDSGSLQGPLKAMVSLLSLTGREGDYGTLAAEGTSWMFAGLAGAHVPGKRGGYMLEDAPLLVDYYLKVIHPRELGFGLTGWRFLDVDQKDLPQRLDKLLTRQIAFGRMGMLPRNNLGLVLTSRAGFMMQHIQQRYAMQAPERVAYWDGLRFQTLSDALVSKAYRRGQVYTHYEGGLETWVNENEEPWVIRIAGETWSLPPFGHAAVDTEFLQLSVLSDGGRVDYVKDGEATFFDGRGTTNQFLGMTSKGPLRIHHLPGCADIWNLAKTEFFGLKKDLFPAEVESWSILDNEGNPVETLPPELGDDDILEFRDMGIVSRLRLNYASSEE